MTEQDVTTAPVGADNMRGALLAYGIDPAKSVQVTGAREIQRAADKGEGARAVWTYWVLDGCDVKSRWTVANVMDRTGMANSGVTKARKIGALLARCGEHAADVAKVSGIGKGATLYQAAKRAANDWDKKTHAAFFGTLTGADLAVKIFESWDLITGRAANGCDAYGVKRKTQGASTPEPTGADTGEGDTGEGDGPGEDVRTVTSLTTDETRAAAAASTLAAIRGGVDVDAASAILAHALRIAIASGMSAEAMMNEWTAASDAA